MIDWWQLGLTFSQATLKSRSAAVYTVQSDLDYFDHYYSVAGWWYSNEDHQTAATAGKCIS